MTRPKTQKRMEDTHRNETCSVPDTMVVVVVVVVVVVRGGGGGEEEEEDVDVKHPPLARDTRRCVQCAFNGPISHVLLYKKGCFENTPCSVEGVELHPSPPHNTYYAGVPRWVEVVYGLGQTGQR